MRSFKAKGLGSGCCNGFTSKIFNRRPFALWHALLCAWTLMGGEGVSHQSIRTGSVEATFDPVLVLQCLRCDLFQKIRRWWRGWRPFALRAWWRRWRSGTAVVVVAPVLIARSELSAVR